MRRRPRSLAWLPVALLSVAVAAWAQSSPVLHEYIEPNPTEDVELAATTPDGAMPAALETESGVVPAPQAGESKPKGDKSWQGQLNLFGQTADATFTLKGPDVLEMSGCAYLVVCKTIKLNRIK